MFDPPLTSLPLVAPSFSSTPVATSVSDSTLLASPLFVAQCMGLEMGEISRGDVSVLEDDSLSWSKELTLVEPHLEEASFAKFCGEVVMDTDTPSIEHADPICNEPLHLIPVSSLLLPPTTSSHLHAYHESLGNIRGYNPSFDTSLIIRLIFLWHLMSLIDHLLCLLHLL